MSAFDGIESGERVGGNPASESEHFFICSDCGQAVDMRDLGEVFRHEERDHKPRVTQ